MMKTKFSALLIHHHNERFAALRPVLEALSIKSVRAQNCKETEARLCEMPCPHLILTDTVLSDGNWMDVLDLAAKAVEPVNVILVSNVANINLYLDAMDQGAFDFMTDSFTVPETVHILKCALDNVTDRRRLHLNGLTPVSGELRHLNLS